MKAFFISVLTALPLCASSVYAASRPGQKNCVPLYSRILNLDGTTTDRQTVANYTAFPSQDDWFKADPDALLGVPTLIRSKSGVIYQTSLPEDQLPAPVVAYARNLMAKSRKAYEDDLAQQQRDRDMPQIYQMLNVRDDEFERNIESYEFMGAIAVFPDGSVQPFAPYTSRRKLGIYKDPGHVLPRSIVRHLKQHGSDQAPVVYVMHSHPTYSPLSYMDVSKAHPMYANHLKNLSRRGVTFQYMAVSESDEELKAVIDESGSLSFQPVPGKIYFMHDLMNSTAKSPVNTPDRRSTRGSPGLGTSD